jgi:hypothetical protein
MPGTLPVVKHVTCDCMAVSKHNCETEYMPLPF